jgi:DNA-binding transcriptional ArsR family regulator
MRNEQLDLLFGALADTTRRAIIARLAKGEASVSELAHPFQMSLPAVTRHIQVLEKAGLLNKSVDQKFRRCQMNPSRLKDLSEWVEHYRKYWEESLDSLETYLADIQAPTYNHKPPTRLKQPKRKKP